MKKYSLVCLLLCAVLLCAAACGSAEPKTFTKEGMSITLTSDFRESAQEGFTVCYDSRKLAVLALKESYDLFASMGDITLEEYGQLVLSANSLDSSLETENGLTFFSHDKYVNNTYYTYHCFVFQGTDAFWLVQFACKTGDAEALKDTIFSYAKSIEV